MSGLGLCSVCSAPTSQFVRGIGWLCGACDPLPVATPGRWRCGHTGATWEGDISNHHGLTPPSFCPGPHVPEDPTDDRHDEEG